MCVCVCRLHLFANVCKEMFTASCFAPRTAWDAWHIWTGAAESEGP